MKSAASASADAWASIEDDKRRDRLIRKVSVVAWTVTFLLVLVMAIIVGAQILQMAKAASVGAVAWGTVVGTAMPLIIVLGLLSLLIATLSTIAVFLRLRTASLAEIQLRLAALEDLLASRPDSSEERSR